MRQMSAGPRPTLERWRVSGRPCETIQQLNRQGVEKGEKELGSRLEGSCELSPFPTIENDVFYSESWQIREMAYSRPDVALTHLRTATAFWITRRATRKVRIADRLWLFMRQDIQLQGLNAISWANHVQRLTSLATA